MVLYRAVVFDCDSTLTDCEGIEELAVRHRREVETLTDAAMRGEVPLEEVYGRRLDLIRPTRQQVEALVTRYVEGLVDDAVDTVRTLRSAGVRVRVVSGGLLPAVRGLARHLGLGDDDVAAVPVRFHEDGAYAGFETGAPAARAGGKADVIRAWRSGPSALPGPVMFVGDGATDVEARDEVELFVAYAGVIDRPGVTAAAPVVLRSRSLAPLLPLALGSAPPDDEAGRDLYERGRRLIEEGRLTWK